MKKRSSTMLVLSALLAFVLFAETFSAPVYAVARAKTATKSEDTGSDTGSNSGSGSGSESDLTAYTEGADGETAAASDSSKTTTSKSSKSSGSKSSASSTPKVDSHGNTILMTDSQRRSRFRSKTNPKRGADPGNTKYRPPYNGFTYADFGTCNSYNSENHLGGRYIYMLGTIMDIEKVYENPTYYGVAILVNDCDGYQWYMRAEVEKMQYANFRALFIGKSGYLFGKYSGYSGVTDRPMMDLTVIYPTGSYAVNMNMFK